ncbi:PucR family transcriptional regulator ligand-binding domain-containing protein [Bacillaceae bacterium S4-13-56]
MSVSLDEILGEPLLKEAKVKTGSQLLSDKYIQSICVIEVPVENFVRPEEFVLTTGIGTKNEPHLLLDFVTDIINSEASVLAFAIGKFVQEVPKDILEISEEKGLIILEIPWSVRFADIIQVVMNKLENKRDQLDHKSSEIRELLIKSVLNGEGIEDIANILYNHLNVPIAVLDDKYLLRANIHFLPESALFHKQTVETTGTYKNIFVFSHPVTSVTVGNVQCLMIPIYSNQKKQGFLLIKERNPEEVTHFKKNIIEHGIIACGLYFLQENAVAMTEIRLKENFLLTIAKNRTILTDKDYIEGKLLGYDLRREYVCLVGKIKYGQSTVYQSSLEHMKYFTQNIFYNVGFDFRRKLMFTFDEDLVIMYVEIHSQVLPKEWLEQFLDEINHGIQDRFPDSVMNWGISYIPNQLDSFSKSYEEAKVALDIGIKEKQTISFYDRTKLNRLLLSFSKYEDITNILNEIIQPLLDYDKKRNADLIKTFVIFNQMKGNVSQTARELNLHRQSLLYRLRNIESLTGLNLGDSDDWFLLEVAVRAFLLQNDI